MSGLSATNLGILKQYLRPAADAQVQDHAGQRRRHPARHPADRRRRTTPTRTTGWSRSTTTSPTRTSCAAATWTTRSPRSTSAANLPIFFFPRPTTSHLARSRSSTTSRPNLTNELRARLQPLQRQHRRARLQVSRASTSSPTSRFRTISTCRSGPNPNAPQATIQNTYQINDNVSWMQGPPRFQIRLRRPRPDRRQHLHPARARRLRLHHPGALPAGQGAGCSGAAQRRRQAVFRQQHRRSTATPTTTGRSTAT